MIIYKITQPDTTGPPIVLNELFQPVEPPEENKKNGSFVITKKISFKYHVNDT